MRASRALQVVTYKLITLADRVQEHLSYSRAIWKTLSCSASSALLPH